MGSTVCDAIGAADGLELVALVYSSFASSMSESNEVLIGSDLRVLAEAGCDVAVDFTVAEASRAALPFLAVHGIHAVVGTTGFDDADLALFRSSFASSTANCIIAANFAISAVLMMRFASLAAEHFDTAEIIELHHDAKVDAPSGTAIETARRMTPRSNGWAPDPTKTGLEGARGATGPNSVPIHSVRMRGMTAHQEVILGAAGQTLTIRQDSYDRTSFMPGVVLACRRVADLPGLTIGLDDLL